MAAPLSKIAASKGIKYFLVSFADLFGTMRAKLEPASAIDGMAKDGAGFWLARGQCGGGIEHGLWWALDQPPMA